jgi:hypothetical protein
MVEKYLTCENNITEYVVRVGKVRCAAGLKPDVLNMPYSHGVFLKGHPQLNITDSKAGVNIFSFGSCSILQGPCAPSFERDWINNSITKLRIDGEEALLKDGILFCIHGGKVSIIESGQEG